MENLGRDRPELVPVYQRLYGRGAYLGSGYTSMLKERVQVVRARHRLDGVDDDHAAHRFTATTRPPAVATLQQTALF